MYWLSEVLQIERQSITAIYFMSKWRIVIVQPTACSSSEFECIESVGERCLDDGKLCDGTVDCPGQEDESNQDCKWIWSVANRAVSAWAWQEYVKDKNMSFDSGNGKLHGQPLKFCYAV